MHPSGACRVRPGRRELRVFSLQDLDAGGVVNVQDQDPGPLPGRHADVGVRPASPPSLYLDGVRGGANVSVRSAGVLPGAAALPLATAAGSVPAYRVEREHRPAPLRVN